MRIVGGRDPGADVDELPGPHVGSEEAHRPGEEARLVRSTCLQESEAPKTTQALIIGRDITGVGVS
jgi:hypothetical protein